MASPGLRKGHHCAYDIHYHFVFVVRYRRALLRPEVEAELVRLSHEIGERYEIEIERYEIESEGIEIESEGIEIESEGIGADQNHVHLLCSAHPVHLLCSAHPKIGPGDIARIYKSITAIQLFKSFPDLRKELWGGKFWSDGYYVSTIGLKGGWPALVRYIQQQGKTPEATNLRFLFPTTDAATQEK